MDSSTKLSPSSATVISEKRFSWPLLGDGLPRRDVDIEFALSPISMGVFTVLKPLSSDDELQLC